jgi:membrane associated rhomboid family serine protease
MAASQCEVLMASTELDNPEETTQTEVENSSAQTRLPIPVYTSIYVAAIVLVFLAQMYSGIEFSAGTYGFVKQEVLANNEYWRMLTGAALHGGYAHVLMNCYAFYSLGKIFEMISSRAHLAIVFLLSAIAGSFLSLYFWPEGISVGASGGILGLIGYIAVYSFRRRQFISAQFRKSIVLNIGFILVFGLILYQVIDNYGHIGGLLTGAIYGFFQIPSDPHVDPREFGNSADISGFLSLAVYLAGCLFTIGLVLGLV